MHTMRLIVSEVTTYVWSYIFISPFSYMNTAFCHRAMRHLSDDSMRMVLHHSDKVKWTRNQKQLLYKRTQKQSTNEM